MASLLSVMLIALPSGAPAQIVTASHDVRSRADTLARLLLDKLTIDEKLDQLVNVTPAVSRLAIPEYNWWTESLHGAGGSRPTTNFPEPIGLAATFNAPLVHDVANAISEQVRGLHTLARQTGHPGWIGSGLDSWSPNINIFRDPRWGRGQETYGEDPFLTAKLAVAFVTGMQGSNPDLPNVIATPKHFAVHSGPESTRHVANVFVSRHDLEDTYLPAFRAAIVDAHAGSIMCAYNRIDGQPACASDELLSDHLRRAWGFQGYVVSDCDAVKDISDSHKYAPDAPAAVAAALRAGVDNECNVATLSDTGGLQDRYRTALARGLVTPKDIDQSLLRLFSARFRNGDLPGLRASNVATTAAFTTPTASQDAISFEAARESIVLLKNNGILPLQPGVKIALIGPLGDATRVLRGNYSSSLSSHPISVLEGLRAALPSEHVTLAPFSESFTDGDPVPESALQTPDGQPGLRVNYYNSIGARPAHFVGHELRAFRETLKFETTPIVSRREGIVAGRSLELAPVKDFYRVSWTGFLIPPETGSYRIGLHGPDGALRFNNQPLLDQKEQPWGALPHMVTLALEKGRRYPITITAEPQGAANTSLVWKLVATDAYGSLRSAAEQADVLVAAVGLTSDLEAEEAPVTLPGFKGGDKTTLDLPPDQFALLERAKELGKPIILVAMNGSPINLAWAKTNAAAVLEAWYPGQSGGAAIADVLTGKANPSGRLPLTFYRSVDDLPPFDDYSMTGRTYRYFKGIPVYPFGYGLSYTKFAYSRPIVSQIDAKHGIRVTTTLRNIGERDGADVAQLYLHFPDLPGVPALALRGFQRIVLAAGEARVLRFDLDPRALSSVTADGVRKVLRGQYTLTVGSGQPGTGVATASVSFMIGQQIELPK